MQRARRGPCNHRSAEFFVILESEFRECARLYQFFRDAAADVGKRFEKIVLLTPAQQRFVERDFIALDGKQRSRTSLRTASRVARGCIPRIAKEGGRRPRSFRLWLEVEKREYAFDPLRLARPPAGSGQ